MQSHERCKYDQVIDITTDNPMVPRLTLYALIDSSFWFETISLGWPLVTGYNYQNKNCISLSEYIFALHFISQAYGILLFELLSNATLCN